MKKIIFASFLLAFALESQAQTLILTNSTTPTTSTTLAGGNSLLLGSGAGNNVTNAAGQNAFVGTKFRSYLTPTHTYASSPMSCKRNNHGKRYFRNKQQPSV